MLLFMKMINLFSEQDLLSFLIVLNFVGKVKYFYLIKQVQNIEWFHFHMLVEISNGN